MGTCARDAGAAKCAFDCHVRNAAQILFLAGVSLIISIERTLRFFFQPSRMRASVLFLGGIVLVLLGWTFIGIIVEGFGFLNLFGDFFPVVLAFLRQLPLIGTFLNLPGVASVVDRVFGRKVSV